jgi:formate hydrogenlyase subunit 4
VNLSISPAALFVQLVAVLLSVLLAPLFSGWVAQCRALLSNRSAPPLWQPYARIAKLLRKDAVLADDATALFRAVPYILFGSMVAAAAIIPSLSTDLPFAQAADVIALVGLFALARVFIALAGMDIGTAFGSLGSRREMLVGFLAEPALLMVVFTASLMTGSTLLPTIAEALQSQKLALHASLAFAGVAFVMVLLAENARIPVDNPTTHLELTMIHEAMVLEYSARHLALVEWASSLKLFNYACIGFALFLPWGMANRADGLLWLLPALPPLLLKLAAAGVAIALIETLSAKLRLFRAPEFLGTAFLLAVLGLLVRLMLAH